MTLESRRSRVRRTLHRVWHYPLSTWPVVDLAGGEEAYAMQGRCGNCNQRIAIVQAKGKGIPPFTSWHRLPCPECGVEGVYGLFDMSVSAVAR